MHRPNGETRRREIDGMGLFRKLPALLFIEEKLTGVKYFDILRDHMLPTAHRLIGQEFIFQEDNAFSMLAQSKSTSLTNLKEKIREEFKNTQRQFLANLIESMPNRCKAVIKAKGGYTKY